MINHQQSPESTFRRGVTLAEVTVSTLLVGLLITTALQSSGGVIRNWIAVSAQYRMAHLGNAFLAEIVQCPYDEPDDDPVFGLESGETTTERDAWDDADDFNGWSSSPPQAADGTPLAGFTGWTRSATVRLAKVSDPSQEAISDEGLKLIEVTVTSPAGETLVLQALRSQWGQLDETPLIDTTWITSVNTSLMLVDGAVSTTASSLPNSVEDTP